MQDMEKHYSLTLFEAQSGALSARLEQEDGSTVHLHSLVEPEQECEFFKALSVWGECIILAGTGLGYHLSEQAMKSMAGRKVVVLEFFTECATRCAGRIAKCTGELPELITSESKSPEVLLREVMRDYRLVQVIKHPASYHALQTFYDSLLTILHNVYKKENASKNRTTVLLHGKFFLQEEIAHAVSKNGDTPFKLDYTAIHDIVEYEQCIQKTVLHENPSSFLSVNMFGIDSKGILSEYTLRHDIPVAIWFVDDPRPILQSKLQFITGNMVAFCWERSYIDELVRAGFHSAHYLPLATDPDLFKKGNELKTRDVVFVGSSMAGEFRTSLRSRFLWNVTVESVAVDVAHQVVVNPSLDIDEAVSVACTRKGSILPFTDRRNMTWLRSYIIHTAGMFKRKQTIKALKKTAEITIFGDQNGWRELCGNDIVCYPEIDYRTKLAGIYGSAKINLNTTSCQMLTAVNQRVFDVPVCGSFLLTDYQSDMDELFPNNEVAVYRSLDELSDLTTFYLAHETACENAVAKACKWILEEHTYEIRYRKLRSVLQMII